MRTIRRIIESPMIGVNELMKERKMDGIIKSLVEERKKRKTSVVKERRNTWLKPNEKENRSDLFLLYSFIMPHDNGKVEPSSHIL